MRKNFFNIPIIQFFSWISIGNSVIVITRGLGYLRPLPDVCSSNDVMSEDEVTMETSSVDAIRLLVPDLIELLLFTDFKGTLFSEVRGAGFGFC